MKAIFITLCCVGIGLGTQSPSYAVATALTSGSLTGESSSGSASDTQPLFASAISLSSSGDVFNSYGAYAFAEGPILRVKAEAATTALLGAAPSATAIASWSDTLTIENPEIIHFLGAFVYFKPIARGVGKNGSATLSASVLGIGNAFEGSDTKTLDFADTTSTTSTVAIIQVPIESFTSGLDFFMQLDAHASASAFDPSGLDSSIDFLHTAELPPLFIGDVNGTPIPELAGLQIVGSSGISYAVTTAVPEPGRMMLVTLGALLLALRRPGRAIAA